MIRVAAPSPGTPEARAAEQAGRALLARALEAREKHSPAIMAHAVTAQYPTADLSLACHWLRETVTAAAASTGEDPMTILPGGIDQPSFRSWRGWELAHSFLAGLWPDDLAGGLEICCRGCLILFASSLAAIAAVHTAIGFHGAVSAAEEHVRAGGALPAHCGLAGCGVHHAAPSPAPG